MSTLVIIAHPDISNSTVNKHWRDALSKIGESVTVHEIHQNIHMAKLISKRTKTDRSA